MTEHCVVEAACVAAGPSVEIIPNVDRESAVPFVPAHSQTSLVHILVHRVVPCRIKNTRIVASRRSKRINEAFPGAKELLVGPPFFKAHSPKLVPSLILNHQHSCVLIFYSLLKRNHGRSILAHSIQELPLAPPVNPLHPLCQVGQLVRRQHCRRLILFDQVFDYVRFRVHLKRLNFGSHDWVDVNRCKVLLQVF